MKLLPATGSLKSWTWILEHNMALCYMCVAADQLGLLVLVLIQNLLYCKPDAASSILQAWCCQPDPASLTLQAWRGKPDAAGSILQGSCCKPAPASMILQPV